MTKATTEEEDERRATTKNGGGRDVHGLIAIPLSTDQNPDSPGEKERILSSGGFVSPPPEPGLSSRVWLDREHTQIGLAMSRSIGDHAVKNVGVISRPVVTALAIDWAADEFIIVATDGVWEFLSSEDAVEIVERHLYGKTAANYDNNEIRGDDDNDADEEDARDDGICSGWGASAACKALIEAASEKWHQHEGNYRDDITAIVIHLKGLWGR
jgi:protein phosphatase 2C family protein 2/3